MHIPLSDYAESRLPKAPGCLAWSLVLFFLLWALVVGTFGVIGGEKLAVLVSLIPLMTAIVFLLPFYWYLRKKASINRENERDFKLASVVNKSLELISKSPFPAINDKSSGVFVLKKYSVGEISRHFDSQINAQITGWLDHEFYGGGVGIIDWGNLGMIIGTLGFQGMSQVNLDLAGTARDNLAGDGFVAVLENSQSPDQGSILRVVAPSEPAAREFVASLLLSLGKGCGEGSYQDEAFRRNIDGLTSLVRTDISYVSDRLTSILRMESNRRPAVSLAGVKLGEHTILGGAIQFDNDERWYQLFPSGLVREIGHVVDKLPARSTGEAELLRLSTDDKRHRCSKCGTLNQPGSKYCISCGNNLDSMDNT